MVDKAIASKGLIARVRRIRWQVVLLVVFALYCLLSWRVIWPYETGTHLISAIKAGDSRAALSLLRAGANPEAQSYTEFWSPLDVVSHGVRGEPYKRFSLSALMLATIGGQADVAEELIRRGANVNEANPRGTTSIDYAVTYRRTAIRTLLIAHGASPHK